MNSSFTNKTVDTTGCNVSVWLQSPYSAYWRDELTKRTAIDWDRSQLVQYVVLPRGVFVGCRFCAQRRSHPNRHWIRCR